MALHDQANVPQVLRLQSTFGPISLIWPVATGNQLRGPKKSKDTQFVWSAPLVPLSKWLDRSAPLVPLSKWLDQSAPLVPPSKWLDLSAPLVPLSKWLDLSAPLVPPSKWLDRSAPLVPLSKWLDRQTESKSGSGSLEGASLILKRLS